MFQRILLRNILEGKVGQGGQCSLAGVGLYQEEAFGLGTLPPSENGSAFQGH